MEKRFFVFLLFVGCLVLGAGSAAALELRSPEFGIANGTAFDVEVTTRAALTCKYSSPFQRSFEDMSPFTSTGGTVHRLVGFELPSVGRSYDFFVDCSGGSDRGRFALSSDASSPSIINASASPDSVLQPPLQTTIRVVTDEPASCKYDPSEEDYAAMSSFFSGSDRSRSNYRTEHEASVTGLADETSYAYRVKCKDLAGRLSEAARLSFVVNTKADPVVTEVEPREGSYHSSGSVLLSVRTNKDSTCSFGNSSGAVTMTGGNFSVLGTEHEAPLALEPGSHEYRVRCVFEGPREVTASTEFTVDDTPPKMLLVDDRQSSDDDLYARRTDQLRVSFDAEDNESGVKAYNYTIVSGRDVARGWTVTEDDGFTVRNLNLKEGKKYSFKAKAQNKAGLWSSVLESNGVTVNATLLLRDLCRNGIRDSHEADVDCGGTCPEKCGLQEACSTGKDCSSGYCSNETCSEGTCDDGLLNQDESDVDCGGACKKCLEGDKCGGPLDCITLTCIESVCAIPGPCFNDQKDDSETDVDCGGVCADVNEIRCGIGQSCEKDSDCESGTCGIGGACTAPDDPDGDGIKNSEDNCPKTSNAGQSDRDEDGTGDACDEDGDNDGLPDEFENKYNLNPLDSSDATADSDNDGLSNLREFILETNPRNSDSDGDGHSDGKEDGKSDPNSAASRPGSPAVVKLLFWMVLLLAVLGVVGFFYYRNLTAPIRQTRAEVERRKKDQAMRQKRDASRELPSQSRGFRAGDGRDFQADRARQSVGGQAVANQSGVPREVRRYGHEPLYRPIPPPPRKHTKGDMDALRDEHSTLSGEEVFERMKKHTRGRRRR